MKWFLIKKKSGVTFSHYRECKQQLSEEGQHQCVYCCISEAAFGGIRNFHVEHFRPKSKFPKLTNEYENLFFACCICNVFKSDDWRSEPNSDQVSYLDPTQHDYSEHFDSNVGFALVGKGVAARYMLTKLYLNRPQLIMRRRESQIIMSLKASSSKAIKFAEENPDDLADLVPILARLNLLQAKLNEAPPYKQTDTRRK